MQALRSHLFLFGFLVVLLRGPDARGETVNEARAREAREWGLLSPEAREREWALTIERGRANNRRHRLGGAIGLFHTYVSSGDDGGPVFIKGPAPALLVQYAYRLIRGFEIGVDVDYWTRPEDYSGDRGHALAPGLKIRLYIDHEPERVFELGASLRANGFFFFLSPEPHPWVGWGFGVGPDVRVWISPTAAIQFGLDGAIAGGRNSAIPKYEPYSSARKDGVLAITFGMWAGVLARF